MVGNECRNPDFLGFRRTNGSGFSKQSHMNRPCFLH